jgi:hypothetical protein
MKTSTKGYGVSAVVILISVFMLSGCCYFNTLRPLDNAKKLVNKQDYASIASLEVKCDESCDGCNQLHLVKGDACYRLAKNGQEPQKYYPCADAELTEGIRLTKQWQMESFNLNRPQTFTNLCESLRNWRDLSKGGQADSINDHLLNTARQFLAVEPGNPCGVYFQDNARYAQLRSCLLHPENCPALCTQLDGIKQSLAEGLAKSGGAECAPNLKELGSEVAQAREVAHCQ